jgi:hypothetical protein
MGTGDDILKGASRLFAKVGGTMKQAGKQVTGIGLGTLRVALDRTRFAPGDKIVGKVMLTLPEPIDAKRLAVAVRAGRRTIEHTQFAGLETLYRFEHELGGAKQYTSAEHDFALEVPKDVPAGPVEWQVSVVLEIPWSRNIDHAVDILVTTP